MRERTPSQVLDYYERFLLRVDSSYSDAFARIPIPGYMHVSIKKHKRIKNEDFVFDLNIASSFFESYLETLEHAWFCHIPPHNSQGVSFKLWGNNFACDYTPKQPIVGDPSLTIDVFSSGVREAYFSSSDSNTFLIMTPGFAQDTVAQKLVSCFSRLPVVGLPPEYSRHVNKLITSSLKYLQDKL